MALTPIAFPQTYDAAQAGPNYSASDFRLTAGAAMAVPDGSGFGGIQGVRAGSPSPLATIDGTTVTVAAHMGWLCPWTGSGCYTYALPEPQQVTVDSTTGSYKIAVVLEDKAAGHGSGERASLRSYPSTTNDSMIPGLVLARVDQGVASDTVPRIRPSSTIMVSTPSDLQRIAAADGIQAELADGARYERRNGMWVSAPHMLTGKKTLAFEGTDSSRLFDGPQFMALAGRPFDPDRDFVSVMLSNRANDSTTSAIGCEYLPKAGWVTVRMNKPINAGAMIDISYLIVLGG